MSVTGITGGILPQPYRNLSVALRKDLSSAAAAPRHPSLPCNERPPSAAAGHETADSGDKPQHNVGEAAGLRLLQVAERGAQGRALHQSSCLGETHALGSGVGEMRDGRRPRGRTCIRVWACTGASAGVVTPFVPEAAVSRARPTPRETAGLRGCSSEGRGMFLRLASEAPGWRCEDPGGTGCTSTWRVHATYARWRSA